jgi:deoxyribonuclease V
MRLPAAAAKARARWPRTVAEARALQERLRARVIRRDTAGKVMRVAGTDVGFEQDGAVARAAVVVLEWPSLAVAEEAVATAAVRFPYVPGYLSFRELPALLAALARLKTKPDLILCDGQGLAHPRRFGLACHLGVLTGIATVGVAKSRLIGTHPVLPRAKGSWVPLVDVPSPPSDPSGDSDLLPLSLRERAKGEGDRPSSPSLLPKGEGGEPSARRAHSEIIGAVLRTRTGVKPLYVSIGHRVSLATAIEWVLRCAPRYRLPETTRRAHRLASG